MLALFIAFIMFVVVLPSVLIATGMNSIIAYLLGFVCVIVVFIGFAKMLME